MTANALNTAEQLLAIISADVESFTAALADPKSDDDVAHEELARNATKNVHEICIRSSLLNLKTAREYDARIIDHVEHAVIVFDDGTTRAELDCDRADPEEKRFEVRALRTRGTGGTVEIRPEGDQAIHVDVFANAILARHGIVHGHCAAEPPRNAPNGPRNPRRKAPEK